MLQFWDLLHLPSAVALAIASQVVNVEDGSGQNYYVRFQWETIEEGGEIWCQLEHWYIVWIDISRQVCDQPIVSIMQQETDSSPQALRASSRNPIKHRAGLKCILFFLPPLQKAIITQQISVWGSAELVLLRSLEAMQKMGAEYIQFQYMQAFNAYKCARDLDIPLTFNSFDLPQIYGNLKRVFKFLAIQPKGNLLDFLCFSMPPELAIAYKNVSKRFPSRPIEAYLSIANTYLEELIAEPIKNQYHRSLLYRSKRISNRFCVN